MNSTNVIQRASTKGQNCSNEHVYTSARLPLYNSHLECTAVALARYACQHERTHHKRTTSEARRHTWAPTQLFTDGIHGRRVRAILYDLMRYLTVSRLKYN